MGEKAHTSPRFFEVTRFPIGSKAAILARAKTCDITRKL